MERGVWDFLEAVMSREFDGTGVDAAVVDELLGVVDRRLGALVEGVFQHAEFQRLEASWRGLQYVVDRVDFGENIRVEVLSVSKDDLFFDLDDAPGLTRSGLYKVVYGNEYDTFGGQPYALLVGDYEFGAEEADVTLLQRLAAVAAMAHAPFVADASPAMFGLGAWGELSGVTDMQGLFEEPRYARWREFRASEDARYVGLCLPRFLLRGPYGEDATRARPFHVADQCLWGRTALALVTRIADSFAKYRWCSNVTGPTGGGAVELPGPTEVRLSARREYELSEAGFIGPVARLEPPDTCFFSACSCQKPRYYGPSQEGREAETSYRLAGQLPYLLVASRFAHYLKVLTREKIGAWMERADVEHGLNEWLARHVADLAEPAPTIRARRPLRAASVRVEDVEGQPAWWRFRLRVRPHLKYMGEGFTLSLVGKIDKC